MPVKCNVIVCIAKRANSIFLSLLHAFFFEFVVEKVSDIVHIYKRLNELCIEWHIIINHDVVVVVVVVMTHTHKHTLSISIMSISDQMRLPAEFKHIIQRRKRNQMGFP